jgi:DNA-binding LacI/PurR family transcriptional regulator
MSEDNTHTRATRRVYQREIAARTGVSTSTVSRVLNHIGGRESMLRQRVLAAASELGYWAALPRAETPLRHVGLFALPLPTTSDRDPFYADNFYLRGVEAECRRQNLHLSYTTIAPGQDGAAAVLDRVRRNHIDALILLAVADRALLATIAVSGLPTVVINADVPRLALDAFLPDNDGGAVLAVQHLLDHGHRRILHITAPMRRTTRRRLAAYQRVLDEAGLVPDPALVLEVPLDPDAAVTLMRARVGRLPRDFTAVFCRNDLTALALLRVLREAGLRVPEDISVVGFDDLQIATLTDPPLTTIRVERERLGAMVVQRLAERIQQPALPAIRVELATCLISRQSVAAAPLVLADG